MMTGQMTGERAGPPPPPPDFWKMQSSDMSGKQDEDLTARTQLTPICER